MSSRESLSNKSQLCDKYSKYTNQQLSNNKLGISPGFTDIDSVYFNSEKNKKHELNDNTEIHFLIEEINELKAKIEKISNSFCKLQHDFSLLNDTKIYSPFFIDKTYDCRNNKTLLLGNHINMEVVLPGYFSSTPLIYPFGDCHSLLPFSASPISLYYIDSNNTTGTLNCFLQKNSNNIFVITFLGDSDNNSPSIRSGPQFSSVLNNLILPITFKLDAFLSYFN